MMLPTLDPQVLQQKKAGDPYLKVLLNPNQAAVLSMGQAQEAIAISSSRVTSMPNMPAGVLGLLNHKSRVLWVIDLPQFLRLPNQSVNVQQYSIAIVRVDKTLLGMVVPEINGVVRFDAEEMESPIGKVAPSLMPYLSGCFIQGQETLWVLDPNAIIQASVLNG
jgi:positive phototaxis protein PixI